MIKAAYLPICAYNVDYFCKCFTISLVTNPFSDCGAEKYNYLALGKIIAFPPIFKLQVKKLSIRCQALPVGLALHWL